MPARGIDGFLRERAALLESAAAGPDAARDLSDLTDSVVSDLAEAALSALRSPWTVLALGGWGARRLLPHSDLDILIVTDAPAPELSAALRGVLYPLWDAGLAVGHQVRSRRDHERACSGDLHTLTATLTGRVLCGDATAGERLMAEVASAARRRRKSLVKELGSRARSGSPYLLEPDLKSGAGGQRDLDELVWLGSVMTGRPGSGLSTLLDAGLIDTDERAALETASSAITAARWEVHRLSPRAASLMTLELAAESRVDAEHAQHALATSHHLLGRVRGRLASLPTRFDPTRTGALPVPPLDGLTLFALLDEGDTALDALEEAAWAGMLDDLVPAFGELMDVRRPALSHRYTVGAHSLRTAVLVGSASVAHPAASDAHGHAPGPGDRRSLQVAALLHDTGKTQRSPGHAARGAAVAETLGPRFGLTCVQTRAAALLVSEHLLLAQTASGEDIHNEDVLLRSAAHIPDTETLDALYRLTVADSVATGPGAWTEWHAALVGELADRLRAALTDDASGAGLVEHAEAVRCEAIALLGGTGPSSPESDFVRRAPLRYLAANCPADVALHSSMALSVASSGQEESLRTAVAPGPAAGTWRVSVATRDRAGLFADICGALSLSGLDIMGADAYDVHEHLALDVFTVRSDTLATVDPSTWVMFERHLHAALADPSALAARLAERQRHYPARARIRTRVDTQDPGMYATRVRVRAADRVGLLYDLALAFAQTGLQIRFARALTKDGVATDVFHVTDEAGEPVDDPGVLGHLAMRIRERA